MKGLFFLLFLFIHIAELYGQVNPLPAANMMAITSSSDTVFFFVADSINAIQLPQKTIRLFTTSKQIQENLSPNYPGIKFVKTFSSDGNTKNLATIEVPVDRPFIKLIQKTTENYKFNNYGGSSYNTYNFDFQIGENGKIIPESAAPEQLERYIRTDPEAEIEYEKYLSSRKWFWIGLSSTLIGGIGAFSNISANGEGSSDPDKITIDLSTGKQKEEFKPLSGLSIGLLAVTVIGMVIMGVNYHTAPPHLVKAVSIYNVNLAKEKGIELPDQGVNKR